MTGILKVDTIQKNNGATPTAADLGLNISGSVLQVVQGTNTAWSTTSSQSLVATGLFVNITPKFASSTILINISINGLWNGGSTSNTIYFDLYKNGSSIVYLDRSSGNNSNPYGGANSYSYVDSPNTTTQIRYELWFCNSTANQCGFNNYTGSGGANNRTRSTITAMEIAA